MRKILLTTCFVCSIMSSYANNSIDNIFYKKLFASISSNSTTEHLKDSVALYTFAVTVTVHTKGKKSNVTHIAVNDKDLAKVFFKDLTFLHNVDFAPVIKNKKTRFVIPIAIIVDDFPKREPGIAKVPTNSLMAQLSKLYNFEIGNSIHKFTFLNPYIISVGRYE